MKPEVWKSSRFLPGVQISSHGRILLELEHVTSTNGYPRVRIRKRNFNVSRLVASEFCGLDLFDTSAFACHKDDDPQHNYFENIFVGNNNENIADMVNKGRQSMGSKVHSAKVNEGDIPKIRRLCEKHGIVFVARKYGLNKATVFKIWKRRTWKHIP